MKFAFVGDWLPGRTTALSELFGDELVIGNLECVVSSTASTSKSKAYSVILNEDAYRHIAASGFAALSLANNHVNDAGGQAYQDMLARLKGFSETQFYGIVDSPFASFKHDGLRLAVIGCLERCRARGKNLFAEEDVLDLIGRLRRDYDRIAVTPHWGKESEYAFHPSPQQRQLAAKWIRAGADGVVGHHSHVIQGREWIDGKPVFYSVGNFEFVHEVCRAYPQTSYGLQVDWEPVANVWRYSFATTKSGQVERVAAGTSTAARLQQHFEHLSTKLGARKGMAAYWAWARRVGPVYIPKSLHSWAGRIRKSFWVNLPKCAAWLALPTTLWLALGCLFRDREFLQTTTNTFEQLDSEDDNFA